MKRNGHSTFTEVRGRGFQFFPLTERDDDRHFHRMPEIAPLLAVHEAQCRIEATHRIEQRNWLLQYEVRAHLECLAGGRFAV